MQWKTKIYISQIDRRLIRAHGMAYLSVKAKTRKLGDAVGVAIETVASGQADAQLIVGDQAKNHGTGSCVNAVVNVGLAVDGRLGRAVEQQLHASGVSGCESSRHLDVKDSGVAYAVSVVYNVPAISLVDEDNVEGHRVD